MKQLYKSNTNKKVAGVCGGIGEYLGIDPTIVRLGFVALSLLAGGGLAVRSFEPPHYHRNHPEEVQAPCCRSI